MNTQQLAHRIAELAGTPVHWREDQGAVSLTFLLRAERMEVLVITLPGHSRALVDICRQRDMGALAAVYPGGKIELTRRALPGLTPALREALLDLLTLVAGEQGGEPDRADLNLGLPAPDAPQAACQVRDAVHALHQAAVTEAGRRELREVSQQLLTLANT